MNIYSKLLYILMNNIENVLQSFELNLNCELCKKIIKNPYYCSNCLINGCYECFKTINICPFCDGSNFKKNEFLEKLIEDLINENAIENEKNEEDKNLILDYNIKIKKINNLIKTSKNKIKFLSNKCDNLIRKVNKLENINYNLSNFTFDRKKIENEIDKLKNKNEFILQQIKNIDEENDEEDIFNENEDFES